MQCSQKFCMIKVLYMSCRFCMNLYNLITFWGNESKHESPPLNINFQWYDADCTKTHKWVFIQFIQIDNLQLLICQNIKYLQTAMRVCWRNHMLAVLGSFRTKNENLLKHSEQNISRKMCIHIYKKKPPSFFFFFFYNVDSDCFLIH